MKGKVAFVLSIAILLAGCGARDVQGVRETTHLFSYGPETVTYYYYDGETWTAQIRELYSYDADARITVKSYQLFDGSDWSAPGVLARYLYDIDGRLDHILYGGQDCRYQYDALGRLEVFEEPCFCAQPNGLPARLVYDALSRVTRQYAIDPPSYDWSWTYRSDHRVGARYGSGASIGRTVYAYDGWGRLERHDTETLSGGVWVALWRTRYTYDIDGRTLERVEEEYVGSEWVLSNRWSHSYDVDGRLVSIIEDTWSGSEWVPEEKRELTFTDAGSSVTFEQEDPEPIRDWTFDYYGQGEVNRYVVETVK